MRRLFLLVTFLAACRPDAGERCNPLVFTNDCQPASDARLSCVYPTTPGCSGSTCCGVAYCCAVDGKGNVVDSHPNCRPDPAAASVCMIDLGVTD